MEDDAGPSPESLAAGDRLPASTVPRDRDFAVWHYTVSHRQLLLRSVKTDSSPTRVDVAFQSVSVMKLPAGSHRLRVHQATPEEVAELGSEVGCDVGDHDTVYVVRSAICTGYVVAGFALVDEADAGYDEPSRVFTDALGGSGATEGVGITDVTR